MTILIAPILCHRYPICVLAPMGEALRNVADVVIGEKSVHWQHNASRGEHIRYRIITSRLAIRWKHVHRVEDGTRLDSVCFQSPHEIVTVEAQGRPEDDRVRPKRVPGPGLFGRQDHKVLKRS